MSPQQSVVIPARITASALAEAIGVETAEVQKVLLARREPDSPDDYIDGRVAVKAARDLGFEVAVEPRDLALECLYEIDARIDEAKIEALPPRVYRLVSGVVATRESLDHEIESASEHWSIARMPMVDRAILRLGLWELRNDVDTPTGVVVSEAVRLADTYSTARSSSFINGVLATLAKSRGVDING